MRRGEKTNITCLKRHNSDYSNHEDNGFQVLILTIKRFCRSFSKEYDELKNAKITRTCLMKEKLTYACSKD